MSADIMERLKSMMSDGEVEAKTEPKTKLRVAPKTEPKPEPKPEPKADTSKGAVYAASPVVPVVVLDDGSTFSNLRGCRVCYVSPDADEVGDEELSAGIDIDSLLTLRDAIQTILGIIGR